ncbi:hypothetical protein HDU85_002593 [Gaertneriomyces sp. JEL0708]|nr:hypothetical protein HDU85_002593 [Gaertneriomyces sp. JEL0708]
MSEYDRRTKRAIISLDFGTAFSGFAIMHKSQDGTSGAIYNYEGKWGSNSLLGSYPKTHTALLYERNGSKYTVKSWGAPAVQDHHNNFDLRDPTQYVFLSNFKLSLDEDARLINSPLPAGLTITRVIGDYLGKLVEVASGELPKVLGSHMTKADVQWVLTVPAVWTMQAKQVMRDAAVIAGIITQAQANSRSGDLDIVKEPEAAMVYMLSKPEFCWQDKDIVLIADCGGGTIDLSLQRIESDQDDKYLRELAIANGQTCGSIFIDQKFIRYVQELVGDYHWNWLQANRPGDVLKLQLEWEKVKKQDEVPSAAKVYIDVPQSLLRRLTPVDLQYLDAANNGHDIMDDGLVLTGSQIAEFAEEFVSETIRLIDDQLQNLPTLQRCRAICLVGGGGQHAILGRRVKERFEGAGRVDQVYTPPGAALAVLHGATIMGLKPSIIRYQVMPHTYGIATSRTFRNYRDSQEDAIPHPDKPGTFYVDNIFDLQVRAGQTVHYGEAITSAYWPLTDTQTETAIRLYESDGQCPKRVTDDGVRYIGRIVLHHPSVQSYGGPYNISTEIFFGRTEIQLKAQGADGKQVQASIRVAGSLTMN